MHSSVCYSYFHFRFTIKCCSVVFGITMTLLVISTSSSSPAINKLHRLLPTMSVTTCHCLPASCWQHLAIAALTACDKARHWWRITIFAYPPAFNGPIRGVPIGILQHVWCEKTMTVWLPDCENFLKICLLNSTEYTNVTDRQTDTAQRHRPRLCMASHGKNAKYFPCIWMSWQCLPAAENCTVSVNTEWFETTCRSVDRLPRQTVM